MFLFVFSTLFAQNIWFNEIHYDNVGTDVGEFIEIVLEDAGSYTLSDFTITLYNGNNSLTYDSKTLDLFTMGITSENFTLFYYEFPANGIQNGAPDGIALDYQGILIPGQFLSYEGTFTALDGPANGVTSIDIGVSESSSTPIGESLQLMGDGSSYPDFVWQPPATETPGNLNINQTIGGTPQPMIIVVSPNGGEEWEQGSTHDITWISINFEDNVKIELEMVWNRTREVLVASTENDGIWEWNIPIDQTVFDWYVIIISDAIDGDPMDQSDTSFSIIEPIPVNPYTIYEIQYSLTGPSPHEGELVETSGVVTAKFADYFFIQDGTGAWNGIAVYPIQDVDVGDEILIVAYVAEYNEKTELTDIVSLEILGLADVPDPEIISTNDLANLEDFEGVLIKVQDVTVTNEDLGYGEWEIDDSSGPCRVDDLGEYTYVPVLNDFLYSITGVVDYTYGNFKLQPRNDDDLNITGLEVYPNTILFLTVQACMGKDFTISNFSEEDVIINNINNWGEVFAWEIEPWTLTFPYTLNAGNILELTVVVNFPIRNLKREIVSDTIYVDTDAGSKKVTLYFDTDLYSSADDNTISAENTLIGNYPNPFKPSGAGRSPATTIYFTAEHAKNSELVIYNVKGQKVRTFQIPQSEISNLNSVVWNGTDENNQPVTSGVYLYKLKTGNETYTKKMLLLK